MDPDVFRIDGERFYHSTDPALQYSSSARRDSLRCRDTIHALIRRYGLSGKQVLSIGPGEAYEEYWFWKAGCALTLVDIDESGGLRGLLGRLTAAHSASEPHSLRYILGDAGDVLRRTSESFECCYVSGFTPDELRREQILRDFRPLLHRVQAGINQRALKYIGRGLLRTWPTDVPPYHPLVEAGLQHLGGGGLFIHQSYASGVDPVVNPHWIPLVRSQLARFGVQLIEMYQFVPQGYVTLTVGAKCTPSEAEALQRRLQRAPELGNFHGRATVEHAIRRLV